MDARSRLRVRSLNHEGRSDRDIPAMKNANDEHGPARGDGHYENRGKSISAIRAWSSVALFVCWSLWWGGLTFYAAVVVPIGTERFGSFDQGLVTQNVTRYLHVLAAIVTGLALLTGFFEKNRRKILAALLLGILTVALTYQHNALTIRMDAANDTVTDDFYRMHAIYLWITTGQWIVGLLTILPATLTPTRPQNAT